MESAKFVPQDGGVVVTGKLTETDAPKGLVTPVPIYASWRVKMSFWARIFAEDAETSFRLIAPAGTRKVMLDPEQTLLTRTH